MDRTDTAKDVAPESPDKTLCSHIFTASAGMVGVCLTAIGIIRIAISVQQKQTMADDLLCLDACLFLGSCLLSYFGLKARTRAGMRQIEKVADVVFLSALAVTVLACVMITYYFAV